MKRNRTGFTLVEMLVVIGIIAVLSAILIGSYRYVVKSAQRAKATEIVSNARAALETLYQRAEGWPRVIRLREVRTHEGGYQVMDEKVAKVLFKYNLLNVDCKAPSSESEKANLDAYKLRGADRCGIADPWAQEVLKKADNRVDGNSLRSRPVSSGGTVEDHLIYFAVDLDDDGFVTQAEGAPVPKVRAKAITWCAGPDGGLGDCRSSKAKSENVGGRTITNGDNVYSWQRAQEER